MIDPILIKYLYLGLVFYKMYLVNDMLVNDKSINPDWVYQAFDGLEGVKGALSKACFIEVLYKKGLPLAGKAITPEYVYRGYNTLPNHMVRGGIASM